MASRERESLHVWVWTLKFMCDECPGPDDKVELKDLMMRRLGRRKDRLRPISVLNPLVQREYVDYRYDGNKIWVRPTIFGREYLESIVSELEQYPMPEQGNPWLKRKQVRAGTKGPQTAEQ